MSEYWKSTPKYWCKHCSTYVKDTKIERTQHESTGRHQGNLRRFLKGIQDGQERGEREKDRAKAEVDRLNRVVAGSSAGVGGLNSATNRTQSSISVTPQASVTERKKQLAQLVDMGIAVPDEFRTDLALAGEWKVVSEKPVEEPTTEDSLSVGVRKRKFEGQEEEEEAGGSVARLGWGSTSRRYPGADQGEAPNLDFLLSGVKSVKKEETVPHPMKEESEEKTALLSTNGKSLITETERAEEPTEQSTSAGSAPIKKEESVETPEPAKGLLHDIPAAEEALGAGVVFKKRKSKSTRETRTNT